MPIFNMYCEDCSKEFEFLQIRTDDVPKCPFCGGLNVRKIFSSTFHVRMDSEAILKSLPDPSPPLEELRGKNKPGCEGGFADKPYAEDQLKNYNRKRDKYGNSVWEEKRRQYFHK